MVLYKFMSRDERCCFIFGVKTRFCQSWAYWMQINELVRIDPNIARNGRSITSPSSEPSHSQNLSTKIRPCSFTACWSAPFRFPHSSKKLQSDVGSQWISLSLEPAIGSRLYRLLTHQVKWYSRYSGNLSSVSKNHSEKIGLWLLGKVTPFSNTRSHTAEKTV